MMMMILMKMKVSLYFYLYFSLVSSGSSFSNLLWCLLCLFLHFANFSNFRVFRAISRSFIVCAFALFFVSCFGFMMLDVIARILRVPDVLAEVIIGF